MRNGGKCPRFVLATAMGRLICAVLLVTLAVQVAKADEACRFLQSRAHHLEWTEHGQPRGARIVSRDSRWQLAGLGWHATSVAACPTCADDQIGTAVMWLGASSSSASDPERDVSPESTAHAMWPFPFQI